MRPAACPRFTAKTSIEKMVGTAQMRLCPPYGSTDHQRENRKDARFLWMTESGVARI
jgi:hypothetical protein